jgi:C4-type Zn-finger protein
MEKEFTCPICGSHKLPEVKISKDKSNLNDKREVKITYIICSKCNYKIY